MIEVWVPANRAERALAWALSPRDLPRYFRVFTTIDLLQPLGPQVGDDPDDRQLITVESAGQTVLPVFTSFEAMDMAMEALFEEGVLPADAVEAGAVVRYPYLRESWPDPRWWLAIDPGLPIEAYLAVDAVDRALRDQVPPDDPEVLVGTLTGSDWEPWPEGANQAVLEAAEAGEAAEYLDALLDSMVTMATIREVPRGAGYVGPDYPWRPVGSPPDQVVEVFTDPDACAAGYPGLPTMTARFTMLVLNWPTQYGLSVNPGGPAGLDLPGPVVPVLWQWVEETARYGLEVRIPRPVEQGMRWVRERDWSHLYLRQEPPGTRQGGQR